MTAAPEDDVPAYRLYTSTQGAERVGGDLSASLFDNLARKDLVEYTRIGNKIRWTDAQLAAAVAYHATRAAAEEAKASPTASRTRTAAEPDRSNVAPLVSRPGSRYANAR